MSKDGLLPSWAAKVHPKYQTPHITTAITGVIVAILAGIVPISLLGELVSIGTLFAFVIVGTGIIILRRTNPTMKRPFKVPFSPYIPIATVLSAAYLMNSLPLDTWIRLIDWMSIGLVLYFAYSYSNSKLSSESGLAVKTTAVENYKPPFAALVAIIATILLTTWQVNKYIPNASGIDYGIRLFFWVVVGLLVAMLMYGSKANRGARSAQVKTVGLLVSLVNLVAWAGITYWFFAHYTQLHGK